MKTILFSLLLLVSAAALAQQTGPDFLNEFKTLLNTDWDALKGKTTQEQNDAFGKMVFYESKKPLGKSNVSLIEYNDIYGYSKEVLAAFSGTDPKGSATLFEQISAGLNKLKSDGYQFKDSNYTGDLWLKTKFIYKSGGINPVARVDLLSAGGIEIHFPKNDNSGNSAPSIALSPNFLSQYQSLLNTSWNDLKGDSIGMISNAYHYISLRPLDGFETRNTKDIAGGKLYIRGYKKAAQQNPVIYGQIVNELSKLKHDGYDLKTLDNNHVTDKENWIKWVYLLKGQFAVGSFALHNDGMISLIIPKQ